MRQYRVKWAARGGGQIPGTKKTTFRWLLVRAVLNGAEGRTQIISQITEKYNIIKNKSRLCPLLCPQYKFRETLED